jgi:hypothetical protein
LQVDNVYFRSPSSAAAAQPHLAVAFDRFRFVQGPPGCGTSSIYLSERYRPQRHIGARSRKFEEAYNAKMFLRAIRHLTYHVFLATPRLRWIKQHLRIKVFYGAGENAVKTQIQGACRIERLCRV